MFDLDNMSSIAPAEDDIYDPRTVLGDKYILPVRFGLEILDIFCSYVIDIDNESIPHASLENAKILFEILDKRPYLNNDSLRARLEYITLVLNARIDLNLDKKSLITQHVLMNCDPSLKEVIEEEVLKGPAKNQLANDTAKYVNNMVYENLSEGYSILYNQKLLDLFDKKENGYYKSLTDYTNDFKKLMNEINTNMQNIERYKREGEGFDLSAKTLLREAKKVYRDINKPSNRLKLGIQALNKMLNGGLEAGRSYLFVGITGVGKSIVLLSVANWIRKYNKLPKKKGIKQAVLFISQENSKNETFERLFNINVSGDDMRDISEEEFIQSIKNSDLMVSDDNINLIFKKYADREIGVSDIDCLIRDYERDGVEIVAVVQDYIEKLKPRQNYSELRHALGSNATELSELAKKWQIPVVTAAQMNRMASSIVDNAIANNKKNTTKLLGRSGIAEAWSMLTNVDAAILINREIDDTSDSEKQYLGFKLEKFRGKPGKDRVYVFLHPFDEQNAILLIPDIDTKPLSRARMEDFEPMHNPEVSSQHVSFDSATSDFRSNFIDIIDDNYKDTSQHYIDIMNKAEEVTNKMRMLQERENEIRRQRAKELKNGKYKLNDNNEIVIESRKKIIEYDDHGRVIIHSRNKNNTNNKNNKEEKGYIVIHSRKNMEKLKHDENFRIIIQSRKKVG